MTDIPIVELKPCPFCGGEAHYLDDTWTNVWHPVHDQAKAANCPLSDRHMGTVKQWNTRAPHPALKECVKALEAGGTRILVLLGAERDAMPAHVVKAFQQIANDMTATLAAMTKGDE